MKKSIESIWKEGFLENKSLEVPNLTNLYEKKSQHLVDRLKRLFRINLIAIVVMAIAFWIVYFFLDAIWQGTSAAVLLLSLAWYSQLQMRGINTLNPGLSSYEYIKSFDQYLKNVLSKNLVVMRFFYPLIFLTAMSTIWFAGDNKMVLTTILSKSFPDMIFVGGVPLVGLVIVAVITILFSYFADKIYRWDINLVYGRIFKKLEETIGEMEDRGLSL